MRVFRSLIALYYRIDVDTNINNIHLLAPVALPLLLVLLRAWPSSYWLNISVTQKNLAFTALSASGPDSKVDQV